jgi:hypothetical protein
MTRRTRIAVLVALALAAGLALAAPAGAVSYRIGGSNTAGVYQIGDWRPNLHPRLADAIAVFGEPTSKTGTGESCLVRWTPIGLVGRFATFAAAQACTPSAGLADTIWIGGAGSSVWYTGACCGGLKIGDSLGRLKQLYTNTTLHGPVYWLSSKFFPAFHARLSVLAATVIGGHVRTLRATIGAQGD